MGTFHRVDLRRARPGPPTETGAARLTVGQSFVVTAGRDLPLPKATEQTRHRHGSGDQNRPGERRKGNHDDERRWHSFPHLKWS